MDINKTILKAYLTHKDETYEEMMCRVCVYYKFYPSQFQNFIRCFTPSSSILTDARFGRLPFSCYLMEIEDDFQKIKETINLASDLTTVGGGIACDFSRLRPKGAPLSSGYAEAGGVVRAIKLLDANMSFACQNLHRTGKACAYLDVYHPEIEAFLAIKKPTGDPNVKAHKMSIAVKLDDNFMTAVIEDKNITLSHPKDPGKEKDISARQLFNEIIRGRLEGYGAYIFFTGNAQRHMKDYLGEGEKISMSNLCTEILIKTSDKNGVPELAVCTLGSVNLVEYMKADYEDFPMELIRFFNAVYAHVDQKLNRSNQSKLYTNIKNNMGPALRDKNIGVGCYGYALAVEECGSEEPVTKKINKLYVNLKKHSDFKLTSAIAPTTRTSALFKSTPGLEHFPFKNYVDNNGTRLTQIKKTGTNNIIPYQFDLDNQAYMRRLKSIKTDQSISCNMHYLDQNLDVTQVIADHIYAWKEGICTLYYLRRVVENRAICAEDICPCEN